MLRRDSTLVLLFTFLSACSMPPGMNKDCEWPVNATNVVAGGLVDDVRVAEELAMRYADSNFESKASHGRLRSGCEAKLFTLVAQKHRVAFADIEAARRQLEANTWDSAVHLPLIALYIALAVILARHVPRRFPQDESVPAALATLFASLVLAGVFQVLGHLWDGTVEMVRLGTTHMSYRVARLGWREYSEEVFALCVVFFWSAVVLSYRTIRPNPTPNDGSPSGPNAAGP